MPIKGLICLDKIMKMLFGVFSKKKLDKFSLAILKLQTK